MRLRISARSSDLAKIQAYEVGRLLQEKHQQLQIEYLFRESLGDKNLSDPLWKMPEKGVFTEDFYQDLQTGSTDMVVHSWKDLPTEGKSDTEIAATLTRADQRDLLLYKKNHKNRKKIKILSSSPRRAYNLGPFFMQSLPWTVDEVEFANIRGNVPTRLRKLLEQEDADGLVLAKAALDRLISAPQVEFKATQDLLKASLKNLNWQVLPLSANPTAAAQGALAVEILSSRKDVKDLLASIHVQKDFESVQQERKILSSHGGGCHQKIGISIQSLGEEKLQLTSLKGLTDQGQILNRLDVAGLKTPSLKENEILDSRELWQDLERQNLSLAPEQIKSFATRAILVSKQEAWPSSIQAQPEILWTAGVKTWFDLAKKGLWVNGSLDSRGEMQLPSLSSWMSTENKKWLKLTHDQSEGSDSHVEVLPTYRINRKIKKLDLKNIKMIYWRSASEYRLALQTYPELKDKFFATGLGLTFENLKKDFQLGDQLRIYASPEDWRNQCLS